MRIRTPETRIRVAVVGYGVIGKRVADAVALQTDMQLAGVADVATDWRLQVAAALGLPIFAGDAASLASMRSVGLPVVDTLENLLQQADVVVDCTPKRVAAANGVFLRRVGRQGGHRHASGGQGPREAEQDLLGWAHQPARS